MNMMPSNSMLPHLTDSSESIPSRTHEAVSCQEEAVSRETVQDARREKDSQRSPQVQPRRHCDVRVGYRGDKPVVRISSAGDREVRLPLWKVVDGDVPGSKTVTLTRQNFTRLVEAWPRLKSNESTTVHLGEEQ